MLQKKKNTDLIRSFHSELRKIYRSSSYHILLNSMDDCLDYDIFSMRNIQGLSEHIPVYKLANKKIIVFEGLEGAGKTRQSKDLEKVLKGSYRVPKITNSPFSLFLESLKSYYTVGFPIINPLYDSLLRAFNALEIRDSIVKGTVSNIILDRSDISFRTFQEYYFNNTGILKKHYRDFLKELSMCFPPKDILIHLHISYEESLKRKEKRSDEERSFDFFHSQPWLLDRYHELIREHNTYLIEIDGTLSKEENHYEIVKNLKKMINGL